MAGTENETDNDTEQQRPMLRVIKGDATPEEIAALVAVLTARAAGAVEAPQPRQSPWTYRRAQLSKPVFTGYGEWRRTGFEKGTRTKADW